MRPIPFKVFLYESTDRLVFTDVDGTITGSDLRGHAAHQLDRVYNHAGVEGFFGAINSKGYKIVYLTARSIDWINRSKQYLFQMSRLPEGPLLCSEEQLVTAFFTEMTAKIPRLPHSGPSSLAEMKRIIILSVVRNFDRNKQDNPEIISNVIAGAYGNRSTDAAAYSAAGVRGDRIWIIAKPSMLSGQSVLTCPATEETFDYGYEEKLGKLDRYY